MTARLLDGTALAADLRTAVAAGVTSLKSERDVVPGLAVVLVGDDAASQVYVSSKAARTREVGMRSFAHHLPGDTTETDLLALIGRLNADPAVHGILVQLPLPGQIAEQAVLHAVDPAKDVDGFHPINAGLLATGRPGLVPCTPLGCVMLAKAAGPLAGREAVVIGRSNIVGKPVAQLLLAEHCTVTIAHSRTTDLPAVCRRADVVIAAVGRPAMVKADWIKPGATVIDVGINRVPAAEPGRGRLVGDVDFEAARTVAGAITPVPGGVGPMTIACRRANTLRAACADEHADLSGTRKGALANPGRPPSSCR